METMHEFIQRLNKAVEPLNGKRINDMTTDFHEPFRAIVEPILPVNFKIGLWGITYIHKHFSETQNMIDFGLDLKKDNRSKGITKGTLKWVGFAPTPKFISAYGIQLPLNEYIRRAIELSIEEKIEECKNDWVTAYQKWKSDKKEFNELLDHLENELNEYR